MEDGDEFIGDGYHLRVIHTPGHTAGTCCFYEPTQKILFSGDHILKHISPNPLVEIKPKMLFNTGCSSLRTYLESLVRVSELDVRFVFPGHGEYLEDLSSIVCSYRLHHQQRLKVVWNALRKKETSPYNLLDDVFPNAPEEDLFLAVSEILVHLDLLLNEGKVEIVDSGPPARYRAI
jgi:glyoxylase-like metal-dependent hydrolase (beta-lactamase superfamily II)